MSQVCIVSFFSSASQGVGGIRARYWFENLSRVSDGKYKCHLVTAFKSDSSKDTSVVPSISNIHFDQGLGWFFPLFLFFLRNASRFDVFIFTSGPFLQLALVPFIKLVYKKQVIIDYRDPFAVNPVFNNSFMKLKLKKLLEVYFNLKADYIITVNKFCKELLQYPPEKRVEIIDNGFDETLEIKHLKKNDEVFSFILAGGFSLGRNVTYFFNAIQRLPFKAQLIHISEKSLKLDSDHYKYLGKKDYSEALGMIQNSDIGLIFTSGHPYESTTKIFDYIRLGKKTLIVSDQIIDFGSLREITSAFPNIVWVVNEEASILKGMQALINLPDFKTEIVKSFSRESGLKKLIKILDSF